MKIALSALQQRSFLTGTGRYLAELFRALPSFAPSWDFLLYVKPDQEKLFKSSSEKAKISVMENCPSSPYGRIFWELARFPGILKKDEIDLYHGPSNFLPVRKKCPFVLTLHDMFFFHNPKRTFFIRSLYWRMYIRATWRLADIIITDSDFSKKQIMKYLPVPEDKIRVIHLGVDKSFFDKVPEETVREMRKSLNIENPYILFTGKLDPDKNQEGLIRAYAFLVESGDIKDQDLLLAGAKDFKSSWLPQLALELGVSERVKFCGYIEEKYLVALYRGADVFCYPSFNEGFGFPPLEAMAAGVPVVSSNTSSIPEVVGDAGVLIDPASVKDIAAGLKKALDPHFAAEMKEAGPERAGTFTWEKTASQTIEVYREVLEKY
jgi:glycosyltransferase involved in cell wall biosynthesis